MFVQKSAKKHSEEKEGVGKEFEVVKFYLERVKISLDH
jgi:hypothetical protein